MIQKIMIQKVVIIGGGPAGLLLANYLLQRGKYQVDVYERRSHPAAGATGNRTFPISLQKRGRNALKLIPGLADATAQAGVFCQGTLIHKKNARVRDIPREEPVLTIDRNLLVNTLLQQRTQNYNDKQLNIFFDCQCINIEPQTNTLTFQPQEGEKFTVNYDLLVGADGARSYVREHLVKNEGLQSEQSYIPDGYKSLYFERVNSDLGLELAANKIHSSGVGDKIRVLLVPQPEDKLNGVIIFNAESNPFADFTTTEEVINFFHENFPYFAKLIPETEAEALLTRRVARVLTVKCDRAHHGNSILLIGDALHAVSPSIGQGCNCALEDVLIFDKILDKYADDWNQALPEFSQQRIPDVHALRELSNYSFPRNNKLLAIEFFLNLILRRKLRQIFPQIQPFAFDLVMNTDIPYSQIFNSYRGWFNKVKRSVSTN